MPLWVPVCDGCGTAIRGSFTLRRGRDGPKGAEDYRGQGLTCHVCGELQTLGPATTWEDVG